MDDYDIKSKINYSASNSLHRVRGGRLYHIFPVGQAPRVAMCGFWPSYPEPIAFSVPEDTS